MFWKWFSVGPDRTVFEMFFLPDRNCSLKRVNQPAAGVERGGAMSSGDHDEDTGFANFQPAQPVGNGNLANLKLQFSLCRQALELLQGHFLVGFILEKQGPPVAGVI